MDTPSRTLALGHLNTDIPELHGYDTGICLANVDEMTVLIISATTNIHGNT